MLRHIQAIFGKFLIISKLEGPNYLENKSAQNSCLLDNPQVAKRKGIHIKVSSFKGSNK